MKILLILLAFLLYAKVSQAQLKKGFNPKEAKEMIALCNSYTYIDLYKDDKAIIPRGYKRLYTSPTLGMDNKFQVYRNGSVGIINFRGSTDKKSSWLENFYSAMLPIKGEITIQERVFDYKFGIDTSANVHSGYVLAIGYLENELIDQIQSLNRLGVYDIILTGHSQGGSLAILTRAFLEYGCEKEISQKNNFKVYSFAQPMVGNIEFVKEYNSKFCESGMSYSMINPDDLVPTMPLSYNDTTYLRDNLIALATKGKEFNAEKMLIDGLALLFQDKLKSTVTKFGQSVTKQIEKELGNINLPTPTEDINYAQIGNLMTLPPPEYPLVMKDSSLLSDSLFLATHSRDKEGFFEDRSVYKKTSMILNHKPYNYYTAVLRKYYPAEYKAIEPKSFGL